MSDHNPNALKHLYGPAYLLRMAESFSMAYQAFNKKSFLGIQTEVLTLEMKPRVRLIRDELKRQLPESFPSTLKILMKALKSGKLKGFDLWPVTEFIQTYGLEHTRISLEALEVLTVLFTSEFAVRPFLIKNEKETLRFLMNCTKSNNPSVRRWASEGSRPRLPWGEKLHHFIKHPELTLAILEELKFDPELFVRKSVANHINDIAKDHPVLVLKTLKRWQKKAAHENVARVEWIIRHSLRTLIKQGHPEALKLLGVRTNVNIKLKSFKMNGKDFKTNDRLEFSFFIQSQEFEARKFVVDYKIHFQKAGGKTSAKVFKLKTLELPGKSEIEIRKSHHLKKVTTRVHYSGIHELEIMINGASYKKVKWNFRA